MREIFFYVYEIKLPSYIIVVLWYQNSLKNYFNNISMF